MYNCDELIKAEENRTEFYNLLATDNPNSEVSLIKIEEIMSYRSYLFNFREYEFEFASDYYSSNLKIKNPKNAEFVIFAKEKSQFDEIAKQMINHLKENGVKREIILDLD